MIGLLFSSMLFAQPASRQSHTRSVEPPSVQVSIDPKGNCQILQSSGDPEQDAKTCALLKACAAKSPNLKSAMAHCDTAPLARKRENQPG
jgi:hypothetical protein